MGRIRYVVVAVLLVGGCGGAVVPILPVPSPSPSTEQGGHAGEPAQASPPPQRTGPVPRRTPTVPRSGPLGGFPDGTPPFQPLPPTPKQDVKLGAPCAPEGAIGYTAAGVMLRCTLAHDEARPRWRQP